MDVSFLLVTRCDRCRSRSWRCRRYAYRTLYFEVVENQTISFSSSSAETSMRTRRYDSTSCQSLCLVHTGISFIVRVVAVSRVRCVFESVSIQKKRSLTSRGTSSRDCLDFVVLDALRINWLCVLQESEIFGGGIVGDEVIWSFRDEDDLVTIRSRSWDEHAYVSVRSIDEDYAVHVAETLIDFVS